MKRSRFEQICDQVEHGVAQTVEHDITHQQRKVIACSRDNFLVEGNNKQKSWARQNCETTHG